jgi:hypothetical protein
MAASVRVLAVEASGSIPPAGGGPPIGAVVCFRFRPQLGQNAASSETDLPQFTQKGNRVFHHAAT